MITDYIFIIILLSILVIVLEGKGNTPKGI